MNKICPPSKELYNSFIFDDPKAYTAQCKRKTDNVLRGRVESAFAENLVFITLTYDNVHLPQTYSQLKDLKIFHERITRKKYVVVDTPEIKSDKVIKLDNEHISTSHIWKEKKAAPLKLDGNLYRKKELFTEQDFKNAKHNFKVFREKIGDYRKGQYGLLVRKHLTDFLECLRNDMRQFFNDKNLKLRYIANGEYGENYNRPHYHIVIFNHHPTYDYDNFMRTYWSYGKILQCTTVYKSDESIKKLTAYIVGHTVKKDIGNQYQNELSPCFSQSSNTDGGIGSQLLDTKKMSTLETSNIENSFLRSLNFSLSQWNTKDPLTYEVLDEKSNSYKYPIPRYYRKKIRKYIKLDTRSYFQAQCNCVKQLVTSFCRANNIHGRFDLLPIYYHLGFQSSPQDILEMFAQFNKNLLGDLCNNYANLHTFVASYLNKLRFDDDFKRETFRKKYKHRKQQKKYEDYLKNKGLINLF